MLDMHECSSDCECHHTLRFRVPLSLFPWAQSKITVFYFPFFKRKKKIQLLGLSYRVGGGKHALEMLIISIFQTSYTVKSVWGGQWMGTRWPIARKWFPDWMPALEYANVHCRSRVTHCFPQLARPLLSAGVYVGGLHKHCWRWEWSIAQPTYYYTHLV